MKNALIITADFLPCNVAGVLRPRMLGTHLRACGWNPIIVTVAAEKHEGATDDAACELLPPDLRIERVQAWPGAVCRPLGFGDVSLRGQFALRRKVGEIVTREKVDVIFCTVLPGYTMLVGAWAKKHFGIPFVLDYQDPWVSPMGASHPILSKAGLAHWLAARFEPGAVRQADALTAVSDETLNTLRARHLIDSTIPVEIIPIGADPDDHAVAVREKTGNNPDAAGTFNLAYVGTMTGRMMPALKTILMAVKKISATATESGRRVKINLIGTSAQPSGGDTLGIMRLASELGVAEMVVLQPRRVPYLEALRAMQRADALLLPGSTDAHYSASKLFPYWLARKPIFGLFHERSNIVPLARTLGGVGLVTYGDEQGPAACLETSIASLRDIVMSKPGALPERNESQFEPYSAGGIARRYAALFDRVLGGG